MMRFDIFSKKTWILIFLMGVFQILSIAFDQFVIQKEDASRNLGVERYRLLEQRSDLLRYNSMIVKGVKLASDISLYIDRSKVNNELKKSFYKSTLLDIGILNSNLLKDDLLKKILNKKKVKYKNYKGELVTNSIYDVIQKNTNEIKKLGDQSLGIDVIYNLIPWTSQLLEHANTTVVATLKETQEDILKNSEKTFEVDNQRQSFLLFSLFFQLTSLLFLLIFFREIMKKNS